MQQPTKDEHPRTGAIAVLEPGPATATWGHYDGSRRAQLSVAAGERFQIATLEARLAGLAPQERSAAAVQALQASAAAQGPGPHIVTGPVEVRGVRAGDTLAVDLHEILLDAENGINRTGPGAGLLPHLLAEADVALLPLDPGTGTALVPPGVLVPLRPFFGIIATSPAPDAGLLDTVPPRANGGNIDCKELVAGSRLLLPSVADGAGLLIGDGHGAQGDGEVDQTAVETALRGVLSAEAVPGLRLAGPVAVTASHLITFGFDEDLLGASRAAVTLLLEVLHQECGLSLRDGYRLCSLVCDLHITQVVNRTRGIHAMFPRAMLDQLGSPAWASCPADRWATQ